MWAALSTLLLVDSGIVGSELGPRYCFCKELLGATHMLPFLKMASEKQDLRQSCAFVVSCIPHNVLCLLYGQYLRLDIREYPQVASFFFFLIDSEKNFWDVHWCPQSGLLSFRFLHVICRRLQHEIDLLTLLQVHGGVNVIRLHRDRTPGWDQIAPSHVLCSLICSCSMAKSCSF